MSPNCQYCGQEKPNNLVLHEGSCRENPNRQYNKPKRKPAPYAERDRIEEYRTYCANLQRDLKQQLLERDRERRAA